MKKQRLHISVLLVCAAFLVFALVYSRHLTGKDVKQSPCTITGSTEEKSLSGGGNKIVAMVDNEPIYEKDVLDGMPPATFAGIDKNEQDTKLQKLIDEAAIRHFLIAKKIHVSTAEVDKEIDEYKKNPPYAGCGCCRYESLESFLEAAHYTLDEFRESVRLSQGMDAYLDGLWRQKYPEKDLVLKLVKERQSEFEKRYIKLFEIRFDIKDSNSPSPQQSDACRRANLAWARLEKGESFEKLAKEMSDDKFLAPKGGCLGLMPSDATGRIWEKIPLGGYSKPIAYSFGYKIIKKEKISTDDIIAILKEEFIRQKYDEVIAAIYAKAVVRRQ